MTSIGFCKRKEERSRSKSDRSEEGTKHEREGLWWDVHPHSRISSEGPPLDSRGGVFFHSFLPFFQLDHAFLLFVHLEVFCFMSFFCFVSAILSFFPLPFSKTSHKVSCLFWTPAKCNFWCVFQYCCSILFSLNGLRKVQMNVRSPSALCVCDEWLVLLRRAR